MADTPANQTAPSRLRRTQVVATKSQRKMVIEWMNNEVLTSGSSENIASRTVKHFSRIFRGSDKLSISTNRKKALRWWQMRDSYLEKLETQDNKALVVSSRRSSGIAVRRSHVKALKGRGRKRAAWVEYVHAELLAEFERLTAAGVKISRHLLRDIALHILSDPEAPVTGSLLDCQSQQPIISHIKLPWIQSFMHRFNIVVRKQSGNLLRSAEHNVYTEKLISYHLGRQQRNFYDGKYENVIIENMDETHFVFNMDDHRALAFVGAEKVRYADVVSGGEGMSLVLRITGGSDPKIAAPLLIFKNRDRNYPMMNLSDDVAGASYRTQPRAWMDRQLFDAWLHEPRAIAKDAAGRHRVLFLDNCEGHLQASDQSLQAIDTELSFLPPNATHLCQPLDSFVIQKFKAIWRREWEAEKLRRIRNGDWAPNSGKLNNPGRRFYMILAAKCAEEVNGLVDSNDVSLVRKAMIRCGLSADTDGVWRLEQLFPHLREIIERHHMEFCGVTPEQ